MDLIGVNPELTGQIGNRPVALDRRQRHLRLERRVVLLPCPFHILLLRLRRFLGAGSTLAYCLIFGGPAQNASRKAGLPSIPSALALMFAKPTLLSLAQNGTRPQRITSRLRSPALAS